MEKQGLGIQTNFWGWLQSKLDRLTNAWLDVWTQKQYLKLNKYQLQQQQTNLPPPPPPVSEPPPSSFSFSNNTLLLLGGGLLLILLLRK